MSSFVFHFKELEGGNVEMNRHKGRKKRRTKSKTDQDKREDRQEGCTAGMKNSNSLFVTPHSGGKTEKNIAP